MQQTEYKLKEKGYWDEGGEHFLIKEVEELVQHLIHSTKKVRFVTGQHVLFFHIYSKGFIIQDVKEGIHQFSTVNGLEEALKSLNTYYDWDKLHHRLPNEFESLLISEEMYNQFYELDDEVIQPILNKEDLHPSLRQFFTDFKANNYDFANISFLNTNYVENYSDFSNVLLFVPARSFIWYLIYDEINEGNLYLTPILSEDFQKKLCSDIRVHFSL